MSVDLDPDQTIRLASEWLAKQDRDTIERAAVPELRTRFGLSTADAVEAIQQAWVLKCGRVVQ